MTIGIKRNKGFLDPKLCLDLWIECGSGYKAVKVLRDKYGIVNPNTGKLVSVPGLEDSAWGYVLDNLVEGRAKLESAWRANGVLMSDVEWYTLVLQKAKSLYTPKKLAKFMEKHSYLKPYE